MIILLVYIYIRVSILICVCVNEATLCHCEYGHVISDLHDLAMRM